MRKQDLPHEKSLSTPPAGAARRHSTQFFTFGSSLFLAKFFACKMNLNFYFVDYENMKHIAVRITLKIIRN
jgi:hypothetical protein